MSDNASIYDQLRDRAVNGGFEPGQRLRPQSLCESYKCSASTIREILFRLSTVGLVEFHEQRGFRLPRQSAELLHDITQFRIMLECEGACLSIRNGGIAWEARLSAAHHKLSHIESRVPEDPKPSELLTLWTMAEEEFHQTLIDSCHSNILKHTHAVIYQQFRQQLITSDRKFVFVPENVTQHRAILDAALAHDEDLVRRRIHQHLSRHLLPAASESIGKRA